VLARTPGRPRPPTYDLERDCLDGYAEGLRQPGWHGSDEILLGYVLSSALRFGLGALQPVLGLTLTTERQDLVGRVFGCSYNEFVGNAAALLQFQQRRIHQARALLGPLQDAYVDRAACFGAFNTSAGGWIPDPHNAIAAPCGGS
jgi:hypothetical protein